MQFTQDDSDRNLNRRQVFRQEVRDQLLDAIFSGTLKAGDKIIETYWAKKLGVSQGPVREAICYLEVLGLVETVPFKGSRVRSMSDKDVFDNCDVQICLELKAMHEVIDKLSNEDMKKLLAYLKSILEKMEEQTISGDKYAYIYSDKDFHSAIIEATDNQALFNVWEQCNLRTWAIFSMNASTSRLRVFLEEHQQIYDALQKRDAEAADVCMRNHLANSMKQYVESVHPGEVDISQKKRETVVDSWHYGSSRT